MREATNGKKIARRIFIKTGIKLEIISGAKEAYIIRNINRIVFNNPQRLTVFIDVGGGSTEISIERNEELIKLKSFKVGTIRMLNDNFDPTIWKKIFTWFSQFKSEFDQVNVVGTGGNINKINKVFGDAQSIFLSIDRIQYAYDSLSALRLEERMEKYGFREDRADVIVPAAEIYLRILKMVKAKHIAVPKVGLADGMAHQLYEDYLKAKQAKGTE
jgi:exopolyphosphatase/guanosine-5'-triphosphate,3'-diphosphate pyrophosphatase